MSVLSSSNTCNFFGSHYPKYFNQSEISEFRLSVENSGRLGLKLFPQLKLFSKSPKIFLSPDRLLGLSLHREADS